jgi:maltose O-acetyltransferase
MRWPLPGGLRERAEHLEDRWDHTVDRALRVVGIARARRIFAGARLGRRVSATGPVRVSLEGELDIGDLTTFVHGVTPTSLWVGEGAVLRIGARVVFNYGVSLAAHRSIEIGDGCMFGSLVRLDDGSAQSARGIRLEEQVWVAHGATIAAGVTIGARSVVSAGSTVTKDVPPDSLAIGSPARTMPLDVVAKGDSTRADGRVVGRAAASRGEP